ncbi:cache domain-containing sensor histidine kinase [Cohnella soli]|uniref:histidine kinase n=1 Tax=Cohnella soli TaxID=425005 RepID=A0ABW0HS53_9BACL
MANIVQNKIELSRIFTRFINVTDDVDQAYLVGNNGQVYSNELFGENALWDETMFRELLEHSDGSFQWTYTVMETQSVSRKLIGISRAIYNEDGAYNGFVLVLLKERSFANFYPDANTKIMMLTDHRNRIISANDPARIGTQLPEQLIVPSGIHEMNSIHNQSYVMSSFESGYTGWKLYIATPYKDVFLILLTDNKGYVLLTLFSLLLFVGLILFFSNRLIAPLIKLNETFDSIQPSTAGRIVVHPQIAPHRGFLARIHFKTKLTIVLMTCIVMPVVLLMFISHSFTQSLMKQKFVEVSTINAEQTIKRIKSYTANLEKTVYYFYYDAQFIKAIANQKGTSLTPESYSVIERTVENAMNQKTDVVYIDLFDRNMKRLYTSKSRGQGFMYPDSTPESIEQTPWLDTYRDYYKDDLITFGRRIADFQGNDVIGYVFITFKEKDLEKNYMGTRTDWNETFIINQNNRVMSHANKNKIGSETEPELARWINPESYKGRAIGGSKGNQVVSYADIGNTHWKMVNVASLAYVSESMEKIVLYDMFVLIGSVLSIVIFVIRYTGRISRPINDLTRRVVEFSSAWVDYPVSKHGGDEIEQLRSNFYLMISRINTLILEVYEIQLKKNEAELMQKEAELITLQSQINPHFLYNTLEVIRWKSAFLMGGDNEVSDLVTTLSEYFRLSLSQGRRTITLAEELEHVHRYIKIMNHRYKDKIIFECDIAEDALQCIVPKITLQPIVENALYHGIKLKSGKGKIQIAAQAERNELRITVSDDGVGIGADRLDKLKEHVTQHETAGTEYGKGGYGLQNIHQRLQLLYGKRFRFEIDSVANEGTRVTIIMPAEGASTNENG